LVAAEWVEAFDRPSGTRELAEVPRPAGVVDDHLLVELCEVAAHRKSFRTLSRPATQPSGPWLLPEQLIEADAVSPVWFVR